jgi:signal transduction histidine kinase
VASTRAGSTDSDIGAATTAPTSIAAPSRAAGLIREVVGTPGPLAPGVDLTAYRIVQEALTNTIRHARAARAAVTLSYEPGYITVTVADSGPRRDGLRRDGPPPDGPGQDGPGRNGNGSCAVTPGSPPAAAGLGLAGIAERVASCGGSLTVGPTPAGGFAVTARLPSL